LLEVEWNPGPYTNVSNDSIRNSFLEKLDSEGTEIIKIGDPDNLNIR
jgi:hypothetical protein